MQPSHSLAAWWPSFTLQISAAVRMASCSSSSAFCLPPGRGHIADQPLTMCPFQHECSTNANTGLANLNQCKNARYRYPMLVNVALISLMRIWTFGGFCLRLHPPACGGYLILHACAYWWKDVPCSELMHLLCFALLCPACLRVWYPYACMSLLLRPKNSYCTTSRVAKLPGVRLQQCGLLISTSCTAAYL